MRELLRPPAHRGPLIASGAVVLAAGVVLAQLRLDERWGAGWQLLVAAALAGLLLWLGLQAPARGGRPRAHESVLVIAGLLVLLEALLWLADVLGVDELGAGTVLWIALLEGAAATGCALRRGSATCGYIAALAFGAAFLAAVEWVSDPGVGAYRWLLLAVAVAFVLVSLVLRGSRPRHSELLVSAAGLAVLAIGLQALIDGLLGLFSPIGFLGGGPSLPAFWELVVLAAGFGLIAYAAADRAAGPAYLGTANVGVFTALAATGDATLVWWPLILIVLGAVALLAGLRPRRPLPPEPDAYGAADLPRSVRATEDELTLRVREP